MESSIKMLKKISEDLGYLKLGGYLRKESMISVIENTLSDITAMLNRSKDTNPDYEKLGEIAKQTVIQTMQEGEQEHGADGWKDMSVYEHGLHATVHTIGYGAGDKSEDHIAHALTRCAMIKYLEG